MLRLMRQHRPAGDIADRIHARHIGAAETIRLHHAALQRDAQRLQAEIFDIGDDARRRQDALDLQSLRRAIGAFQRRHDAVGLLLQRGDSRRRANDDALLLETLARQRGDLGVFDGEDLRQRLDERHLHPECPEEGGEFDADGAGAHDQQRLRKPLRLQRLEIGPDKTPVGPSPGSARGRAPVATMMFFA